MWLSDNEFITHNNLAYVRKPIYDMQIFLRIRIYDLVIRKYEILIRIYDLLIRIYKILIRIYKLLNTN